MRIAIDASGAAKERRTGIGRYIASLVESLRRVGPEHDLTLAVRLSRWRLRRHFLRPPGVRVRYLQEPFTRWIRRTVDLFHGPDLRVPTVRHVPLVATIHDAFSLTSREFAREGFRRRRAGRYRDVLERADGLITVSGASRERLHRALGVPEERIRVVPLGVEERFGPQASEAVEAVRLRHGLPPSYVLFVGQISRRKNLTRLIEAFERLAGDREDLHLVLAGRLSFGAEEVVTAKEASPLGERVLMTGHFPDEDLPGLYAGASVVALPSLDEGFGLPAIEAMACGVPVVASNAGALPEVTAGAALLVDPEDVGALADGLARVLDDVERRAGLIERGRKRAAELTWDRCADGTLAVYREVLGS